jgi:hypothetical protein
MSEANTTVDIPLPLLAELGKRAPGWDVLSILDQGLSRIEQCQRSLKVHHLMVTC